MYVSMWTKHIVDSMSTIEVKSAPLIQLCIQLKAT